MNLSNQSLSAKNIRVKRSERGTKVVYQRGLLKRLGATVIGLVITAVTLILWVMIVDPEFFAYVPSERFTSTLLGSLGFSERFVVFTLGSLVFVGFVFMANRMEFSIESGSLLRRVWPMPRFYTEYPLTLSLNDLQGIGTDASGGAIVVRFIGGKDVKVINNIPKADALALCQALHQHLGVPI